MRRLLLFLPLFFACSAGPEPAVDASAAHALFSFPLGSNNGGTVATDFVGPVVDDGARLIVGVLRHPGPGTNAVWSVPKDGSQPTKLADADGHGLAIAVDVNNVYFATFPNGGSAFEVSRVPKTGGGPTSFLKPVDPSFGNRVPVALYVVGGLTHVVLTSSFHISGYDPFDFGGDVGTSSAFTLASFDAAGARDPRTDVQLGNVACLPGECTWFDGSSVYAFVPLNQGAVLTAFSTITRASAQIAALDPGLVGGGVTFDATDIYWSETSTSNTGQSPACRVKKRARTGGAVTVVAATSTSACRDVMSDGQNAYVSLVGLTDGNLAFGQAIGRAPLGTPNASITATPFGRTDSFATFRLVGIDQGLYVAGMNVVMVLPKTQLE